MLPRLRVLLVEDSDDDAVMLGRLLRAGVGHLVLGQVKTAAELAAALDAGPWDVVLTDYQLPGFDPFDVFAMLRARGLDIPVIIVSGTVGEETAVAAMKAGAHDFFRKDHLARLVPAIERELREAAGRRERRRAEAALRESEARLRLLTDALPVLIAYVDAEGRYQFNNQSRMTRWMGRSRV